jgi:hypothetical protein
MLYDQALFFSKVLEGKEVPTQYPVTKQKIETLLSGENGV